MTAPEQREAEAFPTFTLDRQIADARKRMGEGRWRKLNQEWNER